MERAIALAREHHPHPNPRVGAVVVAGGRIIGEGAHAGVGADHAEVVALKQAGPEAAGSTVYVTLEPCSHTGHTPPCAEALIAAGVSRVVVAAVDPDVRVSGSGLDVLRRAGVGVEVEADQDRGRSVDPGYFRHRETGYPLVTIKYAATLDGSVAAMDGSSQWITGSEARLDAHELRSRMDAVAVGAGTLRVDDPRLDVRIEGYAGTQPRPVVVAGVTRLPADAKIWERDPLVLSTHERDIPSGLLRIVAGAEGRPDPRAAALALGEEGLFDVLLEGGPSLARTWWDAGVIGRGVAYFGSRIAGGGGMPPLAGAFATFDDSIEVAVSNVYTLGDDIRVDFEVK